MSENPAKEVNIQELFKEDPEIIAAEEAKRAAIIEALRAQREKFMAMESEKLVKKKKKAGENLDKLVASSFDDI